MLMEEGLTGIFQQESPPFLQLNPREKCLHLSVIFYLIFLSLVLLSLWILVNSY